MVDAGVNSRWPEPNVNGWGRNTGLVECDVLIKAHAGCSGLSLQVRRRFIEASHTWKRELDDGGDSVRAAYAEECRRRWSGATQRLNAVGCKSPKQVRGL